jgi:dihydroorotate dehydrogenase
MGFPNPGADAVAAQLAHSRPRCVIGVNVGKSLAVTLDGAAEDYRRSVERLVGVADFIVVNVSSPNTPGLRTMQEPELLMPLIGAVRMGMARADRPTPLLIKISPDLDDDQLDTVARVALELELDGIVAVNTTVDRGLLGPGADRDISFDGGGVSGRPLGARALEVLRRLHALAGDELVLVSVGGVETADDVWERILAGASLVQAYTAFVYEGPGWVGRINRELARRLREVGASSLQELVGAGAAPARPVPGAT